MELFLTKYLKLTHAFFLSLGITIIPLCAQWWWPSLRPNLFILCIVLTFVYAAIISIIIHFLIHNLFWRLIVTALFGVVTIAVLFPIFELSPFILAIPGIILLSIMMQLFDNIKDLFPHITADQIRRWLILVLTFFTIFISSMMVGFAISWNSLYAFVLKGEIERKIVTAGINANLIIGIYFWFGAGLTFLSGIKNLWLTRGNRTTD